MNLFRKIISNGYYWFIKKPARQFIGFAYLQIPIAACKKSNVSTRKINRECIDIVVISFNNDYIINMQVDKLRKHIKDPFFLTIADNSTDNNKSKQIRQICLEKEVAYIKLPSQKFFKLSASHGIALNWVYRNYIKKREPGYFGFLDHDIFPVADIRIRDILETQPYYGLKHYAVHSQNKYAWDVNSPGYWYLWAGFCFYNMAWLKNKKVDFMPFTFNAMLFDTGGSNWKSLYANNIEGIYFPAWERVKILLGNVRQSDFIDFIDNKWVHTINGGNWFMAATEKFRIEDILNEFELKVKQY